MTACIIYAILKFLFYDLTFYALLISGFCKNDGNHDVYLLIEVFGTTPTNRSKKPEMMGEAKFAIYPRTEMPRANLFVK